MTCKDKEEKLLKEDIAIAQRFYPQAELQAWEAGWREGFAAAQKSQKPPYATDLRVAGSGGAAGPGILDKGKEK